jgi:hypothetical protein
VQQCCAVFEFLKNHQLMFLTIPESKKRQFQFFENNSKSNNHQFWLFQIPQRTNGKFLVNISKSSRTNCFHERTGKEPAVFWSVVLTFSCS